MKKYDAYYAQKAHFWGVFKVEQWQKVSLTTIGTS